MSRRTAIIEEEYDDPDDLLLPNKSLPNTGTKGAILEAFSDDEGDSEPGPATPSHAQFSGREMTNVGLGANAKPHTVTDITPYKQYVYIPSA